MIVAHVPGTDFSGWDELDKRLAPQVPDGALVHDLTDVIGCDDGFEPVRAWHEIVGSWPDASVMYSVNANVTEDGRIEIALRTRQGYSRGYSYVEVLVLCVRAAEGDDG